MLPPWSVTLAPARIIRVHHSQRGVMDSWRRSASSRIVGGSAFVNRRPAGDGNPEPLLSAAPW